MISICKAAIQDAYSNVHSADFDKIHELEFELDNQLEEEETKVSLGLAQMGRQEHKMVSQKKSLLGGKRMKY